MNVFHTRSIWVRHKLLPLISERLKRPEVYTICTDNTGVKAPTGFVPLKNFFFSIGLINEIHKTYWKVVEILWNRKAALFHPPPKKKLFRLKVRDNSKVIQKFKIINNPVLLLVGCPRSLPPPQKKKLEVVAHTIHNVTTNLFDIVLNFSLSALSYPNHSD